MRRAPVEFDCEGCGDHVFAFGVQAPPAHGFCAGCAWLNEFVSDPVEFIELHQSRFRFGRYAKTGRQDRE